MSLRNRSQAAEGRRIPPATPRLGLALLVIASAQLMVVLDATIVSVALPSVQSSLSISASDLSWVMTAYLLTFGGLLLVGGRAGDLFGRRRIFRIGLIIFTIASLVGGLAPNGTVLIAARAMQGLGAAFAAPTALSLLATTFPAGPARNKALGVYGAVGGLGSVLGLMLGGVLTDYLSWRWVYWVNIPIAIAVLIGTAILADADPERGRIDLPGAVTATVGLGTLIYAITRAETVGWSSGSTVGLLVAASILLLIFLVIQGRSADAMMPPRVLQDRGRFGALLVMLLVGGGMAATFYFLTLYMQLVLGYSPMRTAIAYLPFAIGMVVSAGGIGPRLLARTTERTTVVIGLLFGALGTLWFGALAVDTSPWAVLLPAQLVAGLGLGMAFVTVTVMAVRGVAPRDTGIASGLINTGQHLGGATGLAALVAVAVATTTSRMAEGQTETLVAVTDGYTTALVVCAALYLLALFVGACTFNSARRTQSDEPASATV